MEDATQEEFLEQQAFEARARRALAELFLNGGEMRVKGPFGNVFNLDSALFEVGLEKIIGRGELGTLTFGSPEERSSALERLRLAVEQAMYEWLGNSTLGKSLVRIRAREITKEEGA